MYNELKEQYQISDLYVVFLCQEKQLFTYASKYEDIVDQGFKTGHKFYQSLDMKGAELKENSFVFICHVLFNEKLVERVDDYFVI
jgi:hypothetical protein